MQPDRVTLRRFPIFADLTPEELDQIAERLETIELAPGEELFAEGDPGQSCYFLHLGRISVERATTPGQYEMLAKLDAPTVIGEMAFLRNAPRSARVVAIFPSVLWEMQGSDLDALASSGSAAAYKVMRWIAGSLSDRLADTNNRLIEIYAQPYKSIMELKERLRHLTPGFVSVGMDEVDDLE
ncbi:MAG: cyclic nucleotide-binding domain-containing protein [Candidatus Dadabacteria bacterium]|nr:MAG: cyclic nucleotide-binding domain-containing protein [Candidatus Dadabacteria bacterium]